MSSICSLMDKWLLRSSGRTLSSVVRGLCWPRDWGWWPLWPPRDLPASDSALEVRPSSNSPMTPSRRSRLLRTSSLKHNEQLDYCKTNKYGHEKSVSCCPHCVIMTEEHILIFDNNASDRTCGNPGKINCHGTSVSYKIHSPFLSLHFIIPSSSWIPDRWDNPSPR